MAKDNGNILSDPFDDEGDNNVERIAKEFEKKYVSSIVLNYKSHLSNKKFKNFREIRVVMAKNQQNKENATKVLGMTILTLS